MDKEPLKKQLGDVAKIKRNSFYGKMIEDLRRHKIQNFHLKRGVLKRSLGSPFFGSLEEIGGAYEINHELL